MPIIWALPLVQILRKNNNLSFYYFYVFYNFYVLIFNYREKLIFSVLLYYQIDIGNNLYTYFAHVYIYFNKQRPFRLITSKKKIKKS